MGLFSNDLLILNFLLVILVVGSFLFIRKGSRLPVRLRLKRDEQASSDGPILSAPKNLSRSERYRMFAEMPVEGAAATQLERELNVHFNYNGHSWDAYEVFGLPAGVSVEVVTAAYERMIQKVDPESVEFIQTAYQAIMKNSRGEM